MTITDLLTDKDCDAAHHGRTLSATAVNQNVAVKTLRPQWHSACHFLSLFLCWWSAYHVNVKRSSPAITALSPGWSINWLLLTGTGQRSERVEKGQLESGKESCSRDLVHPALVQCYMCLHENVSVWVSSLLRPCADVFTCLFSDGLSLWVKCCWIGILIIKGPSLLCCTLVRVYSYLTVCVSIWGAYYFICSWKTCHYYH